MKKLLLVFAVLALCGCPSSTPCDSPLSVASMLTGNLAAIGACDAAGSALVKADVTSAVSALGLCSKAAGPIASLVCQPVVGVLESLGGAALDAKYKGCHFSVALAGAGSVLVGACQSLPF